MLFKVKSTFLPENSCLLSTISRMYNMQRKENKRKCMESLCVIYLLFLIQIHFNQSQKNTLMLIKSESMQGNRCKYASWTGKSEKK